jgi:hypothetical protein
MATYVVSVYAAAIWKALGLEIIINDAMQVDRGSAVCSPSMDAPE